jgi:flagellar basal-body rod protein FlgG
VIFTAPDEEVTVNFGIFTFRNLMGLNSAGSSLWTVGEGTGERRVPEDTALRQGMLEGSNVDLADEMTRMMRTQRAFQLASRALTTADEMDGVANNMRR